MFTLFFLVGKSPRIPPPSSMSDSNVQKRHAVSGTRSRGTWCTLAKKTKEPRRLMFTPVRFHLMASRKVNLCSELFLIIEFSLLYAYNLSK